MEPRPRDAGASAGAGRGDDAATTTRRSRRRRGDDAETGRGAAAATAPPRRNRARADGLDAGGSCGHLLDAARDAKAEYATCVAAQLASCDARYAVARDAAFADADDARDANAASLDVYGDTQAACADATTSALAAVSEWQALATDHVVPRVRPRASTDGSRRRRGGDVDMPLMNRGDAAAGTRQFGRGLARAN